MRQRKKKWAEPFLQAHPLVIQEANIGLWKQELILNKPLQAEIGAGKGDFIVAMAKKYPEIHFLAIEVQPSVLALAVKKAEEQQLNNVHFLLVHAERMDLLFEKGMFETIYLNFSDPWPKARHAKRRLTSPQYLEKYAYILKPEGTIKFKSDNQLLYEYTLDSIKDSKFNLLEKQENYILIDNDAETEYEKRFRALGQPIYRIVARKKEELCH